MTDKIKPKALVISPTFFDYYKNILSAFEELGFEAVWMNTWLYNNPVYKILLRASPRLISKLSTKKYMFNIKTLQLQDVAEILVIKGEGLSIEFIQYLRQEFPKSRLHLYLWDAVENALGAKSIAPAFDSVSTFDPKDAQGFNWQYQPLFAREAEEVKVISEKPATYDWVFIGSLHSDRFSVLRRLANSRKDQHFFAFGFIQGRLMWILRHLTNLNLWNRGAIRVSTIAMPSDQVNRIILSAKAVVDIEHPRQFGLTMRSIETLLLGRKLVTTNSEIKNSDLFHESRVCVIDREDPKIPQSFLDSPFMDIPKITEEKYYAHNWLMNIIHPK